MKHRRIGAFVDSLRLLMLEHGIRIAFQEKTRSQPGGPFWEDYKRSVHIPDQWEDKLIGSGFRVPGSKFVFEVPVPRSVCTVQGSGLGDTCEITGQR